MNDRLKAWSIPRKTMAVFFVCLAAVVFAQPPRAHKVPLAAKTPPVADADSLKQGSHNSLTLTRQQTVIQCIELARDAIERADFVASIPLLERVLAEPNSFVPSGAWTESGAHQEALRLLQQIPSAMRQRLDEPRRIAARRDWEQVRTRSTAEVIAFVERFGDLPLGVDALWWLGCRERDQARPQSAVAAFLRVAGHAQATPQQRASALVAAYELSRELQDLVATNSIRDRLTRLDGSVNLELTNRRLSLEKWLADHPHAVDSKAVASAQDARLRRPVLEAAWKQQFVVPLGATLAAREVKQRDLGVRPISNLRPLIHGDSVIVRTLDAIRAFQLTNGERRWEVPNVEFEKMDRRLIDNPSYQMKATDWAQRRTLADSLFNQLTTDGVYLFAIQEPDRGGEFGIERSASTGVLRTGPNFNRLCCYNIQTGALEWEAGGQTNLAKDSRGKIRGLDATETTRKANHDSSNQPTDSLSDSLFLGCPLIADGILYVITQRETEMQLQALNPKRPSVDWTLSLGAALLPSSEDLQRSRVGCPIIWRDGQLICSTGAGAVISVDPLLRTMKWGYRYSATTISVGDLQRGQNPHDAQQSNEPWWDAWREPILAVETLAASNSSDGQSEAKSPSIIVFASPETDQLHAIDLSDGSPVWQVPRDGGLFVAGIVQGVVVVIEGDFIRGHDLSTGEQLWRTATLEVGGPGRFIGTTLVLSAQSGGTMLLDVRNGELTTDTSSFDASLGALSEAGAGWIALSRQSLMWLPRLEDVRNNVESQLRNEPTNEALRLRAAALDLQAGDSLTARGRLEGLDSPSARTLRRQAIIDALRETNSSRTDAERTELARQLRELSEDVDFKFAAADAIGSSALAAVDFVACVEAALDGLEADLDQPESLVKTAAVTVRKDRVLLGLIDEAYRKANPNERQAMDDLFATRIKDAKKSRDRFAVQRLAQQWKGLDWCRRLVVQEDEKTLRKRSPAQAELQLLDAAGSADPAIALQAMEKLAPRLERLEFPQDAAAIRDRIHREFVVTTNPDGTPLVTRSPGDGEPMKQVARKRKPVWPAVEPVLESLDERNFGINYALIPVQAEPGSLASHLDICVERNGSEILFRGDAFFQSGQDEDHERKFKLPPSVSPYRGPSYMLRDAWGIGRIVICLVGSELFAISPLDEQGEPNAKFLWANPIDLQSSPGETRVITGQAGPNEGRSLVVDQSNRPIGRVGPVRAGYLCYQKGSKLVAAETDSGRTLWERLDFPFDATVLGDDQLIYVWRENKVVEILSSLDGRKIEEQVSKNAPSQMIHHVDSLAWTVTRDSESHLELHDLRTGKQIWARTDAKAAQHLALDHETIGVAAPDNRFHLLDARSGTELCPPLEVDTTSVTGLIAWQDDERWYVAMTQPTGNLGTLKALQPNDSVRRRFVSGTLFAIDRETSKILWTRRLKDEPIALDQTRAAPVFIQIWKQPTKANLNAAEGILRVIDKRTGKLLVEKLREDLPPYFLLNPDPQQAILELKLARETIRFRYTAAEDSDGSTTPAPTRDPQ